MPGIPITSLQDLLTIQALQDRADPVRSGIAALAQGVEQGITTQQEDAKAKKKEQEAFDRQLGRGDEFNKTNKGKLERSITLGPKGGVTQTFKPIKLGTKIDSTLQRDARKAGISIKDKTGSQIQEELTLKSQEVATVEELPLDMQIKARALARKIVGARRQNDILPAIAGRIKQGESIDAIEDSIRFAGQSAAFTGPVRSAAQSILIGSSEKISERALDFIDDELSKGNTEGVKDKLKKVARDTAGTDSAKNILGKERTVEFLGEIQGDLDALEANGIDTNIFTGTVEEVNKKIGEVNNPELRKVATKIQVAIQNYRRSISGAAFSVPESKEYRDIFPGIGRTADFNKATISALTETISGDLDNFYSLSMGRDNYAQLFGDPVNTGGDIGSLSDDDLQKRREELERNQ